MLEITEDIFDRDSWSYKPATLEIALCVTTNGGSCTIYDRSRLSLILLQNRGRRLSSFYRVTFPILALNVYLAIPKQDY